MRYQSLFHRVAVKRTLVSIALAAQVSAWRTRESIESRARRVNWERVDEILAREPDVPPQSGGEL